MKAVIIDREQSIKLGHIIRELKFNEEFLNRKFLSLPISDELKAAMYYYAVGICHQTYRLANPNLNLYGWDYLEYGFMEIAEQKPELLDAQYLDQLNASDLIPLIQPFFSPDGRAQNCTLDSLKERVELWIDMAKLISQSKKTHSDYFSESHGNAQYFYDDLAQCKAYSDPLQKKTSFLMKLLEDAKLIYFEEGQDITPIMDYHMQRVLMRTGCVEVLDESLKSALKNKRAIEDDQELREACIESMKLIAKTSGYSIFKMNDVFYTLGRSCCNENMLCQTHSCEKSPCSLSLAIKLENHQECIFQSICKGAQELEYRNYWQPQIKTHFY